MMLHRSVSTVLILLASAAALVAGGPIFGNDTPIATPIAPLEACVNLTKITACSGRDDCFWCNTNSTCAAEIVPGMTCASGWCQGASCEAYECTHGLFPCAKSIPGMLLSMAIYGVILAFGAKTISDGSELLLDLFPSAGTVIGALLLPVLGAVPDAAIVIASGAGGTAAEAQEQLNVGVGTLAGSTIMLLTVPWAASMFIARCDLDSTGQAIDGKLTRKCSLTQTGVSVDKDTLINARIMVGSALAYLIVQGVAFAYLAEPDGETAKNMEHYFALAGFIICMVLFLAYSIYQILVPKLAEQRKAKAAEARRERSMMLHAYYYVKRTGFMDKVANKPSLVDHTESHSKALALKMGRKWRDIAVRRRKEREAAKKASSSSSPSLSERTPLIQDTEGRHEIDMPAVADESLDGEEGEEAPEEPFWKTMLTSIGLMLFGAALVTIFSDPMVDVITDFAGPDGINIPAFYVSFLITPYCSNASEVISSLIFAAKKKKANTSMTFSQLYGAATMNATFVLGIFFALITFRGLAWTFSAETVAILAVTVVVGAITSFKRHFALWWAFPVLALYPLSLVLVYVLENFAHWR